jgi:TRAP-type uncharacterized transport system fused permease subunit
MHDDDGSSAGRQKLQELEEKFDPELRFRPTVPPATWLVAALLVILSCFHYLHRRLRPAARDQHRGVHSPFFFVLGLSSWVFPRIGGIRRARAQQLALHGGVP